MGVLLDLSEVFDWADRKKLRYIPYALGVQRNTITMLIKWNNTHLCAKHDGSRGSPAPNNVGVSQGGPLSEQLFIVYIERAMRNYTNNINTSGDTLNNLTARNSLTGYKCPNWLLRLKSRGRNSQIPIWNMPINQSSDDVRAVSLIYADDTNIDLLNIDGLPGKLLVYNNAETAYGILINMGGTNSRPA